MTGRHEDEQPDAVDHVREAAAVAVNALKQLGHAALKAAADLAHAAEQKLRPDNEGNDGERS